MMLAAAVVLAGALLAMWIFTRFPQIAPTEFRPALMHAIISAVVFYVAQPLVAPVFSAILSNPVQQYVFIFVLILPPLTYRFVSTLWLLNVAQRSLRGRFR